MKRLKYILPLLLILLLGAVPSWPAGAESTAWSFEDGAAQGVTLTAQGDELTVTLGSPGEYTIWLILEDEGFEQPIYMTQHAGGESFPIVLTESRLEEIRDRELTLWVYGSELELGLRVCYGTLEDMPAVSPSPAPSPSPTPKLPQGGSSGSGSYSPPAPAATAPPAETPAPTETSPPHNEVPRFTDTAGHWGEAYITEAAARGLFSGYGDGRFAPDEPVTRAQFVTVLWRMAGRPEVSLEPPFTDTGGEISEFRSAIAWGYDRGYIDGISEDRFSPSGLLTREQAMKILFYFAGGETGGEAELYDVYDRGYADSTSISTWARGPMYWGVYNRIIAGVGDGLLAPQGTATRAQLAKILIVYMDSTE